MSFESAFEPIFSKKRQGLNEEQFKMQLLLKMNQGFEKNLVYCTDIEKYLQNLRFAQ